MLGNLAPEVLWDRPRPWHRAPVAGARPEGPAGVLVDEATFHAWLVRGDAAKLVSLAEDYAVELSARLAGARVATVNDAELKAALAVGAEPLAGPAGRVLGVVAPGHEDDESLTGAVILENLVAKVTGALALRRLLDEVCPGEPVEFLLGSGEEAVGDRYQRGGGNLAKAIGELAGLRGAGGADVKAFCAGPVHALIMAGALVRSGLYRRVIVVGGGSLAKLGMKSLGHLAGGYPILEDILVGVAVDVVADDGRSPRLRLDSAATLRLGEGDAPHHVATALTVATRGLELLEALPDTQGRRQQELTLHVIAGSALTALKGHTAPEVEQAYARARELSERVDDTPRLFPVMPGLGWFYLVRGPWDAARAVGTRLSTMAEATRDTAILLAANNALGLVSFHGLDFVRVEFVEEAGIPPRSVLQGFWRRPTWSSRSTRPLWHGVPEIVVQDGGGPAQWRRPRQRAARIPRRVRTSRARRGPYRSAGCPPRLLWPARRPARPTPSSRRVPQSTRPPSPS
jgi:3-Oxoacyl-[acyl-carrier-protein (ACP)] synthase III